MTSRAVRVRYLPDAVTSARARRFLSHLKGYAETERPRFVLDCSRVRDMDRATIALLLSCLEEAMKSNGDIRLACVRPEAESALRTAGVHRLFEIYPTSEKAVSSFRRSMSHSLLQDAPSNEVHSGPDESA